MSSAPFYDVLVLAVFTQLAGAAVLVAWTLARHVHVSLELRRVRRRQAVLLPLLCRAVSDGSQREALTRALQPGDGAVLLPMLLQLSLDLRGDELDAIARFADDLELSSSERERLRSWRGIERTEAVKNLGLLRARSALPELLHLVKSDRQRDVRIASAWAIGEIGGREAVLGLLSMLEDPDPGVVRRAQEVLLRAAPDAAGRIVSYVRRVDDAGARCAAVEVLGALRDPLAGDLLAELVEDPNPELRTRVIKAAAAIADPRFLDNFRRLLSDPVWSVRCQAATGLGAIGAAEAIPDLCAALADEAWWVRFNAASSLAELGPPGRAALAEATTSSHERCRDVAQYVLLRTRGERVAA